MQADIIAVDQRFDFATKTIRSYAVMNLRGREMRVEIDSLEEVKALISAGMDEAVVATKPAPPITEQQELDEAEGDDENPPVVWAEIGDDLIPPMMKKALTALNTPPVMHLVPLQRLLDEIVEKFTPEQWQALAPSPSPPAPSPPPPSQQTPVTPQVIQAPPPQPPPPPQPAFGQVTWASGAPILPGTNRGRTVQADDYGYPITDDGGVDPGEVIGTGDSDDVDEDGVPQL